MSEKQYQEYFKHAAEVMGPMASQYFRDDPKLLGIHLARYKFVSKMLAGKKLVAEIGCGDGWFSRVVEKEVGELHLYDFDKRFVDGAMESGKKAYVHDVLKGRLEYGAYDGVFSLDVMEHIKMPDHNKYLKNICASMDKNGVAIIGMPSIESQVYASPASKIGHVSCLTTKQLKNKLSKYFHQVFVFGFNDESIHTGFDAMRHYNMAVCCGVR